MFNNKAFNIAFLISFSWHLLCMSAVNIVVLPGKYKMRELTSVSFLGPILEVTALDIMLANKPVAVTTSYQYVDRYSFEEEEKLLLKDEGKKHIGSHTEDKIGEVSRRILHREKEIPGMVTRSGLHRAHLKSAGEISGSVAEREVIYKPEKPQLPAAIASGAPFIVQFEFLVSEQGEVKEVVPIVSSGNPEVDLFGIQYLKSWKFAPLIPNLKEEQRGRIKFIFGSR